MSKYYHATSYDNLGSILNTGLESRNIEKAVYLCKKPEDALKFPYMHGLRDILVIGVDVPESLVTESYDHNEKFFQCKAYMHDGPIPIEQCVDFRRYTW